jgi:hypothetical protein
MNQETIAHLSANQPNFENASLAETPLDKVIVAIHGIGSQRRADTVRAVSQHFGRRVVPEAPLLPLGYFHVEKSGVVKVSRLNLAPSNRQDGDSIAGIGFAEVFWADIPRSVVSSEDTLEETKAWGGTVISRAEAEYRRCVMQARLNQADFMLARGALDEIIETVEVLENLFAIAGRAGLFKFDLAQLLRDYVGDVQLVADFDYFRRKIVYRFHSAMEQIVSCFQGQQHGRLPELYVVAHSEGTVVSFLALLEALAQKPVSDPDATGQTSNSERPPPAWIQHVRGFMTLGSPIDKHLILWPGLWEGLSIDCRKEKDGSVSFPSRNGHPALQLPQQIRWRNYYDYGDPVGFELDTARTWLAEQRCEAFEFTPEHDFDFSRYLLPGKAHTDYWKDKDVFGHFIDDVILRKESAKAPKNTFGVGVISAAIPYVLSLGCHAAGVFFLFKAVTSYTNTATSAVRAGLDIAGITLLLASVTVAARLPRLVKCGRPSWWLCAVVAFLVGAFVYATPLVSTETREHLGHVFSKVAGGLGGFAASPGSAGSPATIGVLLLAGLVAWSGWWVPRHKRMGRKLLIGSGAIAVLLLVAGRLADGETAEQSPVWPLFLAGAAYLYLWWLGLLLFDLAFLWQRYVRNSVAVTNLRHWNQGHDAQPDRRRRWTGRGSVNAAAVSTLEVR